MQPDYPDISNILEAKQQRRFTLAALSWEDKVAIIEQMQQLLPQGQWKDTTPREQGPAAKVTAPEKLPSCTATSVNPVTEPCARVW